MGAIDILRLKPAFNDEQAEALALLVDENMATKRDIADVKRDIAEVRRDVEALRGEVQRDIEALRTELKRDIEAQKTELTDTIDMRTKDLRLEIEKSRNDMTRWVVGMGLATIGVLFTLIKVFA